MLYEIHDINRFSSKQDFCSYARLVKGEKSSAGKRYGSSGKHMGNAHLRWAFSEAALFFLRKNRAAESYYKKLTNRHGKSKALTIIVKRLGIAVYYMLKRGVPYNTVEFLNGSDSLKHV